MPTVHAYIVHNPKSKDDGNGVFLLDDLAFWMKELTWLSLLLSALVLEDAIIMFSKRCVHRNEERALFCDCLILKN